MDCRQNKNVEAVSVWHCMVTTTPRNCCPNCYMQDRVAKTMSVALPLGNNWSKRSPTLCLAQLHLPAHDLFWVNFFVRVQLASLLLISPGLLLLQQMLVLDLFILVGCSCIVFTCINRIMLSMLCVTGTYLKGLICVEFCTWMWLSHLSSFIFPVTKLGGYAGVTVSVCSISSEPLKLFATRPCVVMLGWSVI